MTALVVGACSEPEPPTRSLYSAVHTGDLDQVKRHIYWDTDIDQPDVDGNHPLHVAAHDGRVRIARALVENGADPAALDAKGRTALRVALDNGKTQVALMLLEHGTRLDAQSMLGTLVRDGISDRDSFELLLRRGASLDQPDAEGETLLGLAVAGGHLETVSRLVSLGADVSRPNRDGRRPLDIALNRARRGGGDSRDIVELLERNGAKPSGPSTEDRQGSFE